MTNFLGYSNNKFQKFKDIKVKVFHEKNGWFAKREDTSLTMNSTINTTLCAEMSTLSSLDDIFSDTNSKIIELRRTSKNFILIDS
jgi:hypothetical protein